MLIASEELLRCFLEEGLLYTVSFAKVCKDTSFLSKDFDSPFLGHIGQANDSVRFSLGVEDPDPTNLGSVVGMSSTTGLHIYPFDIDNS